MPHAIRVHQHGGPEALKWEEIEVPSPGPGQVRLRHTAVGLNFIDTYLRSGFYPSQLPAVLGQEGAGNVLEVGPGVTSLKPGDRVAYASLVGAYAEERLAPADRMVKLPDGISDETAAAMMLKGMTVEYLLRRVHPLKAGETILFHAVAGGVGTIAVQWAKAIGATMIGTVGSREKAQKAKALGCAHVVVTKDENFVARTKELTGGEGVPVVYDSVGKDTFIRSLDCLRPRGLMVTFGQSSGPVPPLEVGVLNKKGSLFLTRPSLHSYVHTRAELEESANALFEMVRSGKVQIEIGQRYALKDVAQAHRALEARKTTGSTVLLV